MALITHTYCMYILQTSKLIRTNLFLRLWEDTSSKKTNWDYNSLC